MTLVETKERRCDEEEDDDHLRTNDDKDDEVIIMAVRPKPNQLDYSSIKLALFGGLE